MKNFLLKAFLLMALGLFTFSCTDEPDDTDLTPTIPTSYLKYDGKYFELSKGYLSISDSYFNSYKVELTGPNASYNTWMEDLMGVDQGIVFDILLAENSISLPVGSFHHCGATVEVNEYSYIRFDTNYSYTSYENMPYIDYKNDTIFVSKTGSTYNIRYKGFDQESNPFEIKYIGTLDLVTMFDK
jgi:hypothetical protein